MDPIAIALLVLLAIVVGIVSFNAISRIRRLDESTDMMSDMQRRMDEIKVVIGEGFIPTPDLSNADFEGEADIDRQIDEMRRSEISDASDDGIMRGENGRPLKW